MVQQTEKKKTVIKPLGSRVVAKRLAEEDTMKGGIIIPDSAKKKQEMAEVVAVGPGRLTDNDKLIPVSVKVGDIILMDKYSGQEVTMDNDEEYIIVKSEDITATIEK